MNALKEKDPQRWEQLRAQVLAHPTQSQAILIGIASTLGWVKDRLGFSEGQMEMFLGNSPNAIIQYFRQYSGGTPAGTLQPLTEEEARQIVLKVEGGPNGLYQWLYGDFSLSGLLVKAREMFVGYNPERTEDDECVFRDFCEWVSGLSTRHLRVVYFMTCRAEKVLEDRRRALDSGQSGWIDAVDYTINKQIFPADRLRRMMDGLSTSDRTSDLDEMERVLRTGFAEMFRAIHQRWH